MAYEQLVTAIN